MTRTIDGVTYSLNLTDTAGQEEYRGLWSSSNLHSDAFLLVYDITQAQSLDALEHFNTLIEVERETRYEAGRVLPVCIVAGNKCDLSSMRSISAKDGLQWAKSRGYGFMETSAREMVNIEETFARELRRSRRRLRWVLRANVSCSLGPQGRRIATTACPRCRARAAFADGANAALRSSSRRREGPPSGTWQRRPASGTTEEEEELLVKTTVLVIHPEIDHALRSTLDSYPYFLECPFKRVASTCVFRRRQKQFAIPCIHTNIRFHSTCDNASCHFFSFLHAVCSRNGPCYADDASTAPDFGCRSAAQITALGTSPQISSQSSAANVRFVEQV